MSRDNATADTGRVLEQLLLPERILEVAARAPHNLALVERARAWTYAEVASSALGLAQRLHACGIGSGEVVAICAPPGGAMVVAQLGCWLCGAAFLPLDPSYPRARLEFMLADAQSALLIDGAELGLGAAQVWSLDEALAGASHGAAEEGAHLRGRHGHDLAYLLYTSGSTGKPKGVMVEHAALMNYVAWEGACHPREACSRARTDGATRLANGTTPISRWMAATSESADSECPPSLKKLESAETGAPLSASLHSRASFESSSSDAACGCLAAPNERASALRSILPFGVAGNAPHTSQRLGTMYEGKLIVDAQSFRSGRSSRRSPAAGACAYRATRSVYPART
jgi:AMP-binding enzyme